MEIKSMTNAEFTDFTKTMATADAASGLLRKEMNDICADPTQHNAAGLANLNALRERHKPLDAAREAAWKKLNSTL